MSISKTDGRGKYHRRNLLLFRGRTVAEVVAVFHKHGFPVSESAIRKWIAGGQPSALSLKLIEKFLPVLPDTDING